MKDISLFNNSFNVQKSSTYHLSVQLSLDGYSFTIADAIRKRFNAIRHVPFTSHFEDTNGQYLDFIKTAFEKDAFLGKNYKAVNFVYAFSNFIIIPQNSFSREDLKNTYLLHYELRDDEEIQFNFVKEYNLYIVFSVPSDLTNLLVTKFPQVEFHHQASVWLKSIFQSEISDTEFSSVYFNSDYFLLFYGKNGMPQLINAFQFASKDEMIYKLVDAFHSIGLEAAKFNFLLAGDIDDKGELYKKINAYFPFNSFMRLGETSSLIYLFDEVPEHQFISLLSLE